MIQANELRIGNWVNYARSETIVDPKLGFFQWGINDFYNIIEGVGVDWEDYDPISLTPEILEKAGFTSVPVADEIHWMKIYTPQENLPGIDLPVFKIAQRADGTFGYPTRPVKYVHTFQNLYFALTGEELKLDL